MAATTVAYDSFIGKKDKRLKESAYYLASFGSHSAQERKNKMSALPLPLELTKPVVLAGDLDTQLRATLGAGKYDPEAQLCWGNPGTSSNQESESSSGLLVIDVTIDVQVDDNDF